MKKFFKENYKELIIVLVIALFIYYPLPYYIFAGGGTTSIENKFIIENKTQSEGSYRFSYVREIKASPLFLLLSYVIPEWESVSMKDYQYDSSESMEDLAKRDKLLLEESNGRAAQIAYQKAGKDFEIISDNLFVIATFDIKADEAVKVGDEILKVEKKEFKNFDELLEIMKDKSPGDKIEFELKRDDKVLISNVEVKEIEGKKVLGIAAINIFKYKSDPTIKFNFDRDESGPSGGFMLTLAIYDSLIPEDLSKGRKIVGSGEILPEGRVGIIGGIKHKLVGAVKDKADVFFAPAGENYEEAIKLKEKNKYKIEIVSVETIDDAINYLRGIDFKDQN